MAPYDSDDSLDDEQDYTETDVLLGYASKEPNGETISRLGGRPDWIIPDQPPSFTHAKCSHCSSPAVLLLQLNGDLPDRFPGHERRLYVFSCRKKTCRRKEGSIRVLRATRVSAAAAAAANATAAKAKEAARAKEERETAAEEERRRKKQQQDEGLGEALFGVPKGIFGAAQGHNANPFAAGGGGGGAGAGPGAGAGGNAKNPFATPAAGGANPFSSTASLASPPPAPAPAPASASEAAAPASERAAETERADESKKDLSRTFAETLSLNNNNQPQTPAGPSPAAAAAAAAPEEPWPAETELPAPFPVSYLAEADYETLDPLPPPPQNVSVSNMDIDDPSSASNSNKNSRGGGGKEDKDVFESTIDSTFQKFADRIGQNPDQCIRYEFGGAPLLYSKTDGVGHRLHDVAAADVGKVLPRCGACGAGRVFEVQMTPQAIVELEGEEESLEGMDWGTVVVAVCERDCLPRGTGDGEVGYSEEWVGVQWEELTARR